MHVLVTGAGGFLGRHVVRALLDAGHTVRALVRPTSDVSQLHWDGKIEVARADLSLGHDLLPALANIEVVLHLAAKLAGESGSPQGETVTGTRNLLEAIKNTAGVRRLVLASSFSVYDWSKIDGVLTEDSSIESDRVNERDGYAIAKVDQENLCRRWARDTGRELVILRPGAIWGRGNLNLPNLGQKLGPVWLIFTPGSLRLTYVENCALAFAKAVDAPAAAGRAFNIVDNHAITPMEYAKRLGGKCIPVKYGLAKIAPTIAGGIHRFILQRKGRLPSILTPRQFEARFKHAEHPTTAAQTAMGWSPRYSFEDAWQRATAPLT